MKATDRCSPTVRLVAGVLVSLLMWASPGPAQSPTDGTTVADVIIHGNRMVPTQRVMSLIRTRAGGPYSKDTINEDVRKLFQSGLFGNVNTQTETRPDGQLVVYFVVVEYPSTIQEIVYQGAKHIKPSELDNLTGLRKGGPLNPISNQMACRAITRRYHEMGRPLASCQLVEGDKPGDRRVVFNITEGPQVKVKSIQFTGNTFVSGPVLATHISTSRQWVGLFGGTFNPVMADLDVAKLEEYYRSFGFHDVRVRRELVYDAEGRYVTLVFHIHEGPQYKVGGIQVVGSKSFSDDELLRLCKGRQGESYNQGVVDNDKTRIQDYIGYTGRNAAIKSDVFYPPDRPGVCLVQYQVQERPPDKVGQIFVVGNEVTRENVIIRQLPLYPGQLLSYPDLRIAERNLARLGIFEINPETGVRPSVTVIDPYSDNEYKDILVQIQETRTGSLVFGFGVNSNAGLTGSVVLNEKNFDLFRPPTTLEDVWSGRAFRGGGQEFRLEAVPGTQVQRYAMSFREPSLFDSPFSLDTSAYYYTRLFNEYDETRLGGRVTVGRQINDYWSAAGGVRLENVGVRNVLPFAPYDIQSVKGNNFIAGFRGSVVRDSRDSFLRPTEGSRAEASFEQVVGDFTFPVLNLEYNQYFTTYQRRDGSGRHVLALHSQFALAGSQAPVFERFYAGGYRSLRGFEFRGVSPEVNGFKIGGDFMFLNSMEYQIPLVASEQILLVGFLDSGTVESKLSLDDYRVTAGFGFRFTVPLLGPVPIALDFGFPIKSAPGDREQVFSFWLGWFR